jgi:hypothetical protein
VRVAPRATDEEGLLPTASPEEAAEKATPSMCMPNSPPLAALVKSISTQSPRLARMTSGWIASSRSPSWTLRLASCARTASTWSFRTYILPWESWSPKRLSGMSTSIAWTSKRLTAASSGQGAPAERAAVAVWAVLEATSAHGTITTSATAPRTATRGTRVSGRRQRLVSGAPHGVRRAKAPAVSAASGRLTARESSVSRPACSRNGSSWPPWLAWNSAPWAGPPIAAERLAAKPTQATQTMSGSRRSPSARAPMRRRAAARPSHTSSSTSGRESVPSRSQWSTKPGSLRS